MPEILIVGGRLVRAIRVTPSAIDRGHDRRMIASIALLAAAGYSLLISVCARAWANNVSGIGGLTSFARSALPAPLGCATSEPQFSIWCASLVNPQQSAPGPEITLEFETLREDRVRPTSSWLIRTKLANTTGLVCERPNRAKRPWRGMSSQQAPAAYSPSLPLVTTQSWVRSCCLGRVTTR
jgi:hypothetical protein